MSKGRGTRTWTGYDDDFTLAVIDRFLHVVEERNATLSYGSCSSDGLILNQVATVLRGVREDVLSSARKGRKSAFEKRVRVLFLAMDAQTLAGVDAPGDRPIDRALAIEWAAKRVGFATTTVLAALEHGKWNAELQEAKRRFTRLVPGAPIPLL